MKNCALCKFLTETQSVKQNVNGITTVSKCILFGIQVLNLEVDECTGCINIQHDDSPDKYANTNSFDEQYIH